MIHKNNRKRRRMLIGSALLAGITLHSSFACAQPNIIFIYADDLGVASMGYNGGSVKTQYIDRIASEGMQFTDAHSSSAVCTPSRYAALTGRHCWRTHLQKGVYNSPDHKPLITKERANLASMLKAQGYHTTMIGKWHLGIGWEFKEGSKTKKIDQCMTIDYSKPATTPADTGFDYFYGTAASLDMPPYTYIENKMVVEVPTEVRKEKSLRPGASVKSFKVDESLQILAKKSVECITQRAQNKKQPFFLYLPLTSPHNPVAPSKDFIGKSKKGLYGDFVLETDWVVGQVLKALDDNNIAKNTIIIFSADNGHHSAGKSLNNKSKFRGLKTHIYEGGHRVPFVIRWPETIKPAQVSDRTICQTDLMATFAEILKIELKAEDGVDSESFYPALLDPAKTKRVSSVVHHSFGGSFAIRKGDWKLCFCKGSGGFGSKKGGDKWQLFNLKNDIGEKHNLIAKNPEVKAELTKLMESYIKNGRSTPGEAQKNDVEVKYK